MTGSDVGLGSALLRDLYGTPEVRAVLDSRALIQGWLDAEVALARAEADVGVIPAEAADRIAREADASSFDVDRLREGIASSQHPLVPLIRLLAERCGEMWGLRPLGRHDPGHVDTGAMLQTRAALALIRADVGGAAAAAATLAARHAADPMPGRTHGQHAVPIAFGQKAASWTDELGRCETRLDRMAAEVVCGQLGGAAGSLAALGDQAAAVRARFAVHAAMPVPSIAWHAARDRVREIGQSLAQVAAAGERIAAEVVRLQATEVGELREPATDGHVGSSTMPQKRNPMTSEYLIASARLAYAAAAALEFSPAHAGERDMGLWAVEWVALPEALVLTSSVASKLRWVLERLEVEPRPDASQPRPHPRGDHGGGRDDEPGPPLGPRARPRNRRQGEHPCRRGGARAGRRARARPGGGGPVHAGGTGPTGGRPGLVPGRIGRGCTGWRSVKHSLNRLTFDR